MHPLRHTTGRITMAVLAAAAVLGACGDDRSAKELDVEAVDFAFEGMPEEVSPGTHLRLRNTSTEEVHEAVVFRVPEERRNAPLADLLASAESDPMALGELVGVSVALPGEDGIEPEGQLVLEEAGRYVIVCFVPTGADPDLYRQALDSGTPPDVSGGLPHLAHGMVAELTVG